MNTIVKTLLLAVWCLVSSRYNALAHEPNRTDTFKVHGNCGLCKERIEGSLRKKAGIVAQNWDTATKILTVTYEPSKVHPAQIRKRVAEAGHDIDNVHAKDAAYNKLSKCCQYERVL